MEADNSTSPALAVMAVVAVLAENSTSPGLALPVMVGLADNSTSPAFPRHGFFCASSGCSAE